MLRIILWFVWQSVAGLSGLCGGLSGSYGDLYGSLCGRLSG